MEKKTFEETHPHLKSFTKYLDELNKETERGAALISAAMLDDLLAQCLSAFLIEHQDIRSLLEGFNAPLGTLSARTVAAFAVGLISDEEYKECQTLRKIRNAFAHNVHVSFQDQNIRDLCSNLALSAKDYGEVHVDARGQFTSSAACLILNLTNRPHYVGRKRLTYHDWPY
jgi:mannitol operon repressor